MSTKTKKLVIVGGGTAGWLSAGIIAAKFMDQPDTIDLTLIESPDVPTIGVGEGTWPTMRSTLKAMGISETCFFRECDASFKQGSKFVGWKDGDDADFYLHPFTLPHAYSETDFYSVWKKNFSHLSFCDAATIQGQVGERHRAPKLITTPEYAGVLNYGYHLNAAKFADLLKEHCVNRLSVKHVSDTVTQVHSDEHGFIRSLSCASFGEVEGDFFIDCSGSQALLIEQHFKQPLIDVSRYSFNNSALAVQVAYASDDADIASFTSATARSAGWIWDIGLSSRCGVGYVYSAQHISDGKAEDELRSYLHARFSEAEINKGSIRKLSFTPGYREKFWHKNCVAVGMAAGFIEPLEASALALVELSANMIRDELPIHGRASMEFVEKRFNSIFTYRWQRIIEFLKLHYCISHRADTDYWIDVKSEQSVPTDLLQQLDVWQHRPPYFRDLLQTEEIFPSASYQYILYGLGFDTNGDTVSSKYLDVGCSLVDGAMKKFIKYLDVAPSNRELINDIHRHGMRTI